MIKTVKDLSPETISGTWIELDDGSYTGTLYLRHVKGEEGVLKLLDFTVEGQELDLDLGADSLDGRELGSIIPLRGVAASKPSAGAEGQLYIETDSPYKIWRDNGTSWDNIAFAAAAGDTDIGFHDLTITLDDPTAYGADFYGERRTVLLNPNAAVGVKTHTGFRQYIYSDASNVQDPVQMQALQFEASHRGSGSVSVGVFGISGIASNQAIGTIAAGADLMGVYGYTQNKGTINGRATGVKGQISQWGPSALPTWPGIMALARGGHFTIENLYGAQMTTGYGADIELRNINAASVITTLYGDYVRLTNEGTIGTYHAHHIGTPADTGTIQNNEAIRIENQNGIGTVSNYAIHVLGGENLFVQDLANADPVLTLVQDDTGAAEVCLRLDQDDISEGFIDFLGSDRGVITGATNSVGSVRVEVNGVVRRFAAYADA